ncbi:MAG: hypothetical protein M1814_006333 [Vezdaea aestivalis]|nr:MAG: hypothetical protein M1814_006333 [Vezdaea aestivalis]
MPNAVQGLPSLLKRILGHPRLPADCWYLTSSLSLASLNQPQLIPTILKRAFQEGTTKNQHASQKIQHDDFAKRRLKEQSRILWRIREGLLKGSVIYGLPRAINAVTALKNDISPLSEYAPTTRRRALQDSAAQKVALERGDEQFGMIYGKIADRIRHQLQDSGHSDLLTIAELMYAHILSEDSILGARETSLCVVAALAGLDVEPQLKGHRIGAINCGSSESEVNAVLEVSEWIKLLVQSKTAET